MGVSDNETKAETMIVPARTMPNSRKSLPVKPCKKIIGRKTAAKVIVVEIIAK